MPRAITTISRHLRPSLRFRDGRQWRSAFTLVEVVVAMAVLATISAGLLATTWRLVGFARDEAEHMVADAYCHDVMWAVYSQNYSNILDWAESRSVGYDKMRSVTWEIINDPDGVKAQIESQPDNLKDKLNELPWVETINFFGKKVVTVPLWRMLDTAKVPTCTVRVLETPTNKVITVEARWYNGYGEQVHSNVVTRVDVERKVQ